MLTLIETPLFTSLWPDYWTEEERGQFCSWLALNVQENVPAHVLQQLRKEIDDADD